MDCSLRSDEFDDGNYFTTWKRKRGDGRCSSQEQAHEELEFALAAEYVLWGTVMLPEGSLRALNLNPEPLNPKPNP